MHKLLYLLLHTCTSAALGSIARRREMEERLLPNEPGMPCPWATHTRLVYLGIEAWDDSRSLIPGRATKQASCLICRAQKWPASPLPFSLKPRHGNCLPSLHAEAGKGRRIATLCCRRSSETGHISILPTCHFETPRLINKTHAISNVAAASPSKLAQTESLRRHPAPSRPHCAFQGLTRFLPRPREPPYATVDLPRREIPVDSVVFTMKDGPLLVRR